MKLQEMKLNNDLVAALKKVARYFLQFAIIVYLFYQLYEIGIQEIVKSLPTEPLFYLIFVLIYYSLPLAEVIIYKTKWPVTLRNSFPIFIQKKVLNSDVLGYSGEIYLYQWAKNTLGRTTKDALHFIKDNNILSSIASTSITVVLLLVFVNYGYININDYIGDFTLLNGVLITLVVIIIGAVVFRYRDKIIALDISDSFKIFSLHASRILLINVLQILQWKVAKPEIGFSVWFTFSAVQILASRIPFLPSKDALFVTVALEMTDVMTVPRESLVGVLAANLILTRIFNLISYGVSNIYKRKQEVEVSENEKEEFYSAN